ATYNAAHPGDPPLRDAWSPSVDACVLMLTGHMHKRGRFFGVDLIGTDGQVHNPPGGFPNRFEPGRTHLFGSPDYTDPGALRFTPPVLHAGEALHYACWDDNGVTTAVRPVFHGTLQLLPASGRIDRKTGSTTLVVSRWTFIPNPDSNGMHPEQEPVLIALGDDSFLIGAGALRVSHGGRLFTYHGPRPQHGRGVRSFRMHHNPEDSFYTVSFRLMGVDFLRLNVEDPLCRPLAVIVGADDGFVDVSVTSPSFSSRRVSLPRTCIDP